MAGFMKLQVWQSGRSWFARYSAPGYMDSTDDTGPCDSPTEAARECFALYGDGEPGSADRSELASVLWQLRRR